MERLNSYGFSRIEIDPRVLVINHQWYVKDIERYLAFIKVSRAGSARSGRSLVAVPLWGLSSVRDYQRDFERYRAPMRTCMNQSPTRTKVV